MLTEHLALEPLRRIVSPTREQLFEEFVKPGRPVVLAGAAVAWACVARWTPAYLAERCGKNEVLLRHIEPEKGVVRTRSSTVGAYLDEIARGGHGREYLAETPLRIALPQLLGDVPADPYTGIAAEATSVMLGADTYAPCHYHPNQEAISTQVAGRRRFVLFAPDQTPYLYPRPQHTLRGLRNFSRADFAGGALSEWPLVAKARGYEAVLEPGDSIFIPVQYWHAVFSLGGFSILLARFFPSSFLRYHYPNPGVPALASRYVYGPLGRMQQRGNDVLRRLGLLRGK